LLPHLVPECESAGGGGKLKAHRTKKNEGNAGRLTPAGKDSGGGVCAVAPTSPTVAKLLPFLEERIDLKIPSHIDYMDQVLDYLNQRLVDCGVAKAGDCDLMIALDEAIVNAIKHGNKGDPEKTVHIVVEINAEGARFTIRDEGGGFQKEGLPDPREPSRLLVPSGRGLLLINHIMDEVRHNERGNEIHMVKRGRHKSPKKRKTKVQSL
jgi:serine/threonine-protein kinase RsbW